ncbi:MAG: DUF6588 family protein [Oceanihabitans sp.]
MKKIVLLIITLHVFVNVNAQENIDDLLAAGISDAKRFTKAYLTPATNGLTYGINTGWFNNAKSPKRFGVEVSVIGNASFIKDKNKSFSLDVSDYENVRFPDGSASKKVATALGENNPEMVVIVTYDDPIFGDQEVELTLPNGVGSEGVNLIPTAFLQVSFSPFRGTQLKGRYFPKINTDDVKLNMYGFGLQQEFTTWLPADKLFPVAISGLIAYTHLDGSYDFTDNSLVEGENQRANTDVNTLLFQIIAGTKLKVLNAFGSIGYLYGTTKTDLLGTYRVTNGILFSEDIKDPFSVKSKTKGVTATVGANVKVGFFSLNASYTLAEFDSASLGLNFSF